MAINYVNIGSSPNDGTGDNPRVAFDKVNSNFRELDGRANSIQGGLDSKANKTYVEDRFYSTDIKIDNNFFYGERNYAVKTDVDKALDSKANQSDVDKALADADAKIDRNFFYFENKYTVQDDGSHLSISLPQGYFSKVGSAVVSLDSNGMGAFTFPSAFNQKCYSAIVCNGDSSNADISVVVKEFSTTQIVFYAKQNGGLIRFNYVATGK